MTLVPWCCRCVMLVLLVLLMLLVLMLLLLLLLLISPYLPLFWGHCAKSTTVRF